MHTTEEQMEREGIVVVFDSLLAHSIFGGNGLAHVGGVTPYNVVFGRQPSMLPPLEIEDEGGAGGNAAANDDVADGVCAGGSGMCVPSSVCVFSF